MAPSYVAIPLILITNKAIFPLFLTDLKNLSFKTLSAPYNMCLNNFSLTNYKKICMTNYETKYANFH